MEDTQVMDLDYTLEVTESDEEGTFQIIGWIELQNKRHELKEGEVKIGRDPSTCKIVIDNEKTLSKEHAVLDIDKTSVTLMDLGSRNKTKIGKMILKPNVRYALQGGEKIKFGAVQANFIANEQLKESDSDACSLSVLDYPYKKALDSNQSNDSSVISPTPQISNKNFSSTFKGTNITKSLAQHSVEKSTFVSPTPQSSGKNNSSTSKGRNVNRSFDFVPETPANNSSFMSGSCKDSFATQSTPFTSYARSVKEFTSPAFLSPITDMNSDIAKASVDGSTKLKKVVLSGPISLKLDETADNMEKDGYNSDESTDVEDFFADDTEAKKKNKELDGSVDVCALPTQPFIRDEVKAPNASSHIDNDDTQEILAAFDEDENKSNDDDSTQDVFAAFEECTQNPYVGEITECATQQFDKTSSGTLFRKPFAAALKIKPKSPRVGMTNKENLDIFDAPTQICLPSNTSRKAENSDQSDSSDDENIYNMPTQKFSDSVSLKESKHKDDIFDAPTQVFVEPTDDDVCDAPTQIFDAPTQVFKAPEICDAPTQVFDAPDIYDAPTQIFDVPTRVADSSPQVHNSPLEKSEDNVDDYEALTQKFDDSPHDIDVSTSNETSSSAKNESVSNKSGSISKVIDSSKENNDQNKEIDEADLEKENTLPISNVDEDEILDSTQRFESDNEDNDETMNLPTVPIEKIQTHKSNTSVDDNAEPDDDTDSNASETLLQNEEPVEDELLEKTQKFSYSLFLSEKANKSKDKENEDAYQSDTDDENSCASDTLLKINNEEDIEKASQNEKVDGYNSDESTDVERDDTILFTKSILNKKDTDTERVSINKSSLSKENIIGDNSNKSMPNDDDIFDAPTQVFVEPTDDDVCDAPTQIFNAIYKMNTAANVSSATNETEGNDLSRLELTGDSATLHETERSGKVEPDVQRSEEAKVLKCTNSNQESTYNSQFNTSEFGYSCFEIDSSILISDDSKSPVKKSIKAMRNEGKAITPSNRNHIEDDMLEEIEEMDPNDINKTSKSQALFDLSSDDDDDVETLDNEPCLMVTPLADKNDQTSTPIQKNKKLNLEAVKKDKEIELPNIESKPENFSERISESREVDEGTSQPSETIRGTRLSRRNKNNKLEDSEPLITKSTVPNNRKKTKLSIITKKVESVSKRTRRTENLDKSSISEEIETSKNKRLCTSAESEVLNSEITPVSKRSSGRKRNADSDSSEVNSNVIPKEKNSSPSRNNRKQSKQIVESKAEISNNENQDALEGIVIPDEKPICNKPYQKPSTVAENVISPKVEPVRTTRGGRKSAAPSRYSPSKPNQTSDCKRNVDSIDISDDVKRSSKKTKVEVQKKNKNSDTSTSEINISTSSNDINIVSSKEKNCKFDTSQDVNLEEDKNAKELQKLPAKNNQRGKKTQTSEMTKPRTRTCLNVSEAKESSVSISPPISRVTRHVQNSQTITEVDSKDSKSVNIRKKKEKTDIESTSIIAAKRKVLETDKESKADEDKVASCVRSRLSKSPDSSSVIPDLKNQKEITMKSEVSKSVRSRSSRLKAKNVTEENDFPETLNIIEPGFNIKDSGSEGKSRLIKSVKAKENDEKLIPVAKEETIKNDTNKFVKPIRSSRASKPKTVKNTDEISITPIDKESKPVLDTKNDTDNMDDGLDSENTTTVRRSRRAGNTETTYVNKKIYIKGKVNRTNLQDIVGKKSKNVTPPKNIENKDTTLITDLPRASTRHSQRIELEEEDKTVKEDCLSVCSFSSDSSDTVNTNKRKRGRPSIVPTTAVRKSTRGGGKLLKIESEVEMSIISEDSLKEAEAPIKKSTRSKLNTSISPTRSIRSKRSRDYSPSFSKEEMLWSPAQRQSMASKQPRVLFTTFKDSKDEKIVKDAGGRVVESASECTVLVTNAVKRTCKLLACVGKGVPIVSPDWIVASKRAQSFVDPWQYLISDSESEKKFVFSLKNSLKAAAKKRLFSGYSIYVTDSVKPPPNDMREIIECAGGEYMDTPPKMSSPKVVVVSCEQDKKLLMMLKKINIPFVSNEFILTGLLRQKIMINEYKINV